MLLPFLEVLRQVGTPLDRYLAQDDLYLIYLGECADSEALLPLYPAIYLVERFTKQEGLPILGILAAQQMPIQQMGMVGHILSQSLTLLDLIVTIGPLVRLVNSEQDIRLRWESDAVWIEHICADPEPSQHQQSQYNAMAHLLSMVRLALGPSWTFPVIHLSGSPCRELAELPDYANSELHFRQNRNALKIPRALLS